MSRATIEESPVVGNRKLSMGPRPGELDSILEKRWPDPGLVAIDFFTIRGIGGILTSRISAMNS